MAIFELGYFGIDWKKRMKTTVVGSYPVPTWLQLSSSREGLRDAMLAVIKTQEMAGIELIADGELYRWDVNHAETNGMIDFFLRPLDGVNSDLSREQLIKWKATPGNEFRKKPPGIVVDELNHGTLNLNDDYQLYAELTDLPKKFTVTSPYMLSKMVANDYYPSTEALVNALGDLLGEQVADIEADVIQVDEANVTGNTNDGAMAAEGINRILRRVKTTSAVHLCFGNYGGQTIQQGDYDLLVEFLNKLEADHVVLEMARRPDAELAMLERIVPDIEIGLGVIDIKDNGVESPETVARRIEEAANVIGADRIAYVHPDCGFWMLPRSVADAKMAALRAGRDLYAGG